MAGSGNCFPFNVTTVQFAKIVAAYIFAAKASERRQRLAVGDYPLILGRCLD